MRKIIFVLLTTFLLSTPAFAEMKVAYVNLQKALNDSVSGAQAKVKIAAQAKEYETEFKSVLTNNSVYSDFSLPLFQKGEVRETE